MMELIGSTGYFVYMNNMGSFSDGRGMYYSYDSGMNGNPTSPTRLVDDEDSDISNVGAVYGPRADMVVDGSRLYVSFIQPYGDYLNHAVCFAEFYDGTWTITDDVTENTGFNDANFNTAILVDGDDKAWVFFDEAEYQTDVLSWTEWDVRLSQED